MAGRLCELYAETEHEELELWSEASSGYKGVVAVHDTTLGPALGGTRLWAYTGDEAASEDAIRLSRCMTYKNALAGLPFGGGKAVILSPGRGFDRRALFRAHGRFVETFRGRFITGEDVGTTPADMEYVREETPHVAGLAGGSGDPSPLTARGLMRAIEAAADFLWGSREVAGRVVTLQGCGSVGYHLARELSAAGARLKVTDLDAAKVQRVVEEFGAVAVEPEEVCGLDADIFAPCALGGVINETTIGRLKVKVVAGAANDQLRDARLAAELEARGILFVPDFVAGAGGVISGCTQLLGWSRERCREKVEAIFDTTAAVLVGARAKGVTPYDAAVEAAADRLRRLQTPREASPDSSQH